MAERSRTGPALAVLALAMLGATDLSWIHFCDQGTCGVVTAWSHLLGIAVGLLAAALLVCEALPLLGLGMSRAFLGAALAFAVAATTGLLVGFEVANVDFYGGKPIWIGSWVRIALALLLASAGCVRVRGHLREVPREQPEPEWLDGLFVGGVGLAFASGFLSWAVPDERIGGGSIDGFSGAGAPAVAFGLLALAVVAAEGLRLAGVRPAKDLTLGPATIIMAGLTAIFGLLSVISVAHQLGRNGDLGRGAWVALGASAALVVGAVLRLRELRLD